MRRLPSQILVSVLLAAFLAGTLLASPRQAVAVPAGEGSAESLSTKREAALVDLLLARRRLADVEQELRAAGERLDSAEAELNEVMAFEARATRDYDQVSQRFAERTRQTYKQGRSGWLELLVGSGDLGDFLTRLDLLGKVLTDESRLLGQVSSKREELGQARAELEKAQTQHKAVVQRLHDARSELREAERSKKALADSLGEQLREAEEAARRAEIKMGALNQAAENNPGTEGPRATVAAGGSARGAESSGTPAPRRTTRTTPTTDAPGPAVAGRQLRVKVTAYCLPGTTATGVAVGRGVIAVDPRVIPLGTRLLVPGYGEGIAADTGGAVKGNFIDVWLPEPEAVAWGVKYLTITILG